MPGAAANRSVDLSGSMGHASVAMPGAAANRSCAPVLPGETLSVAMPGAAANRSETALDALAGAKCSDARGGRKPQLAPRRCAVIRQCSDAPGRPRRQTAALAAPVWSRH